MEAESSAQMLLLCSESGPAGPAGAGSSWQDILLSSNRSSGGGEMLNTGLRLEGVFWGCCWDPTPPAPGSPPVPELVPLPPPPSGADRAPSTPCLSDPSGAPDPSLGAPLGWWWRRGGWNWSMAEVEGSELGPPVAKEDGQGLDEVAGWRVDRSHC